MTVLLRDPPELKQYAMRGDPPIDKWPGQTVDRQTLMRASGDQRDWFWYGHRLLAYEEAWGEFVDARRRRNFKAGFDWNQILVIGDFSSGKTTLGISHGRLACAARPFPMSSTARHTSACACTTYRSSRRRRSGAAKYARFFSDALELRGRRRR